MTPIIFYSLTLYLCLGKRMGDPSDNNPADPRQPQGGLILRVAGRSQLLEHRQLQRCHGDHSWPQVSTYRVSALTANIVHSHFQLFSPRY